MDLYHFTYFVILLLPDSIIWVTQQVLTLRQHLSSSPVCWWDRVTHLFNFCVMDFFVCVLFVFVLCLVPNIYLPVSGLFRPFFFLWHLFHVQIVYCGSLRIILASDTEILMIFNLKTISMFYRDHEVITNCLMSYIVKFNVHFHKR